MINKENQMGCTYFTQKIHSLTSQYSNFYLPPSSPHRNFNLLPSVTPKIKIFNKNQFSMLLYSSNFGELEEFADLVHQRFADNNLNIGLNPCMYCFLLFFLLYKLYDCLLTIVLAKTIAVQPLFNGTLFAISFQFEGKINNQSNDDKN